MSVIRKVSEMAQIQASIIGALELYKCDKITFDILMVHLAAYTEVWQDNAKSTIDENTTREHTKKFKRLSTKRKASEISDKEVEEMHALSVNGMSQQKIAIKYGLGQFGQSEVCKLLKQRTA